MPMAATRSPADRRLLRRLQAVPQEAGLTQVNPARRLRRNQSYVAMSESCDRGVDAVELQAFARLYLKPLGLLDSTTSCSTSNSRATGEGGALATLRGDSDE